jgi:hypothetical protein
LKLITKIIYINYYFSPNSSIIINFLKLLSAGSCYKKLIFNNFEIFDIILNLNENFYHFFISNFKDSLKDINNNIKIKEMINNNNIEEIEIIYNNFEIILKYFNNENDHFNKINFNTNLIEIKEEKYQKNKKIYKLSPLIILKTIPIDFYNNTQIKIEDNSKNIKIIFEYLHEKLNNN